MGGSGLIERLREAREKCCGERGARQFALKAGLNYHTYRRWEIDTEPSVEDMARLAAHWKINLNWLLTGQGEMFLPAEKSDEEKQTPGENVRPLYIIKETGEGQVAEKPEVPGSVRLPKTLKITIEGAKSEVQEILRLFAKVGEVRPAPEPPGKSDLSSKSEPSDGKKPD